MHYRFRGANDAFRGLVKLFNYPLADLPIRSTVSRAGNVRLIDEPVVVTYTHPLERVLFNRARDANPFFHLFESLWMLAGRDDVEPLARYNSQIAQIASDDDKTFNGAYGRRWRYSAGSRLCQSGDYRTHPGLFIPIDQLRAIVAQLQAKPESRRCVLQMWNVEDDLLRIDETKDVCCNVCAFFSLRPEPCNCAENDRCPGTPLSYLDMTVCNRSNDLTFGMLGANIVHFSFLLEYMAACIGVGVGVYNQITNNLHVYTDRFKPEEWLADVTPSVYDSALWRGRIGGLGVPLVKDPAVFDREVVEFIDNHDWTRRWEEPFLDRVAAPMCWAFELHRRRDYRSSLLAVETIAADDWRIASHNWIERRRQAWESKNVSTCAD